MAKSKDRKPHPKPPADAKTVVAIKKEIVARKEKLAKVKTAATKDGKLERHNIKVRTAVKRVKRTQRKLLSEAYRLQVHKTGIKPAAPVAAAAEGEKKE